MTKTIPHPCQVAGCENPKVPGQGGKLCPEHRDKADIWRRRDRYYIPICQMPECTEPKLRGHGHRYCPQHYAEGPQRESAQVMRRRREREFGLAHAEFLAMLHAQGGVCAICGNGNDGMRQLSVDHDHVTGAVRGLLCDRCNPMLGYARDSTPVLQAAIAYLERTALLT